MTETVIHRQDGRSHPTAHCPLRPQSDRGDQDASRRFVPRRTWGPAHARTSAGAREPMRAVRGLVDAVLVLLICEARQGRFVKSLWSATMT